MLQSLMSFVAYTVAAILYTTDFYCVDICYNCKSAFILFFKCEAQLIK